MDDMQKDFNEETEEGEAPLENGADLLEDEDSLDDENEDELLDQFGLHRVDEEEESEF